MTLQQTLQPNASRIKELFSRLEDTSDQAVKTRENLYEELSRELRLHTELEQRHLIPALRNNDATKELAPAATKTNNDVRTRLTELDAMAKDDEAFRPRLIELRKLHQQQLKDERQELVPAAEKKLPKETVEAVAKRMEATRARAEDEQRAEEEAKKLAAKREADQRKAAAASKQAVADVVTATKENAKEIRKSAAEAVRHRAENVRETSERAADKAQSAIRRIRTEVGTTVTTYRDTARERGEDLKAVGSAVRTFARVGKDVRSVLVDSVKRSGRISLEMSRQLVRNPRKFRQVQRDYATASSHNLLESAKEIFQIVRDASGAARQPIDQRLRAVS